MTKKSAKDDYKNKYTAKQMIIAILYYSEKYTHNQLKSFTKDRLIEIILELKSKKALP